jgi:hypothetical protein
MHLTTDLPRRPPSAAPRVWAGAVMLLAGVALVVLAGCFLIGVLGLLRPELFLGPAAAGSGGQPAPLSAEDYSLMLTLYVCAFASLVAAVVLLVLGIRVLRRAVDV